MTTCIDQGFLRVDVSLIPTRPELSLEKLFGVNSTKRPDGSIRATITLTEPALKYLCCFSSDGNAEYHADTGLVQGSLWMWVVQLVVSEWIPKHGPLKFDGTFPAPSFSKPDEQLGFELIISKTDKRSLQCVVRGPLGSEMPVVFKFNCIIFPMEMAERSHQRR